MKQRFRSSSLVLLLAMGLPAALLWACGDSGDGGTPSGASGSGQRAGAGGSNAQGGEDSGGTASGDAGAPANAGSPAGGSGGEEGGDGGAPPTAGAGGTPEPEPSLGQRFVDAFNAPYLDVCECLVEGGAYPDVYACIAVEGYPLMSNNSVTCLDDAVEESPFLAFYLPCVATALDEVAACGEENGCGRILGHTVPCSDGGTATRCNDTQECSDDSDEMDCPDVFSCDGGELSLLPSNVCDGLEHCADGTDEADCEDQLSCYQILSLDHCGMPGGVDGERLQICAAL